MDIPDNTPAQQEVHLLGTASPASKDHESRPFALQTVRQLSRAIRRWLAANTFAPGFLPEPWTRPALGYLAALVIQVITIIGILMLVRTYPSFRFPEGLLILVILLVALGWGAGPGLVATASGAGLLIFFIVPPSFALVVGQEEDIIGVILYLVVGVAVSILVGQAQRARYRAEALSTRLETIIKAIPDPLVIYDQKTGALEGAVTITRDISALHGAEQRVQFLAGISKVLSSSLDYQATLANISQLVVPTLADWFVVDLIDTDGHFELIEVGHKNPEKVQWARELREKFPVDPHTPSGAPAVVRTGKSELYREITEEMLVASARNEEELAISRQIGISSVMIVPLVARGKTLGVVTFVYSESGRKYTEPDLALAEEVGRRAGVALDNAHLYREMQRARDQLEIILRGVADGIIVYDSDSSIIYANEAAAQLTGSSSVQSLLEAPSMSTVARYELIDEQGQPFPHSRLTHLRVLAGELEPQAVIGYRDITTKLSERWSLVKSRPVLNEHGEVAMVVTIVRDITEMMLAERRKDEFISMASHELKTPVTSLKGFTHVLQRRLKTQSDEQGLHYLDRMDAQLNKLTKLISDLLDISRMQTGKLTFDEKLFDLNALVRETLENLQAATSTHELLLEGRTDAPIFGDKDRIGQVLINLLTNAVKYSPGANKVLVRLTTDQDRAAAIVSVQDFGIGISEAHHQKIFERFYQVTDPQERTYPGLGIGLYISHEIVQRHHGRMWIESRKGEGATFSVALPLYKDEKRSDSLS